MDQRLPDDVVAQHYEIELAPDLPAATFSGSVAIDINIVAATGAIVCNSVDLTISEARLDTADGSLDLAADLNNRSERLTLTPRNHTGTFKTGPARLHVRFNGILNDQLRGFYRSTYRDESGHAYLIATTQFQPTDARRAFPCWDEPALKATFTTSLVVKQGLLAISNTAETAREPVDADHLRVRFARSMPMSTYLVAFVVGQLEATEPRNCGGVPVRVIHRPGRAAQTAFALEVAEHALGWFSDYYGMGYPSDKLDLVAVPDFAFGAMENLGCVIFREVLLLVEPSAASQTDLQRVADVINHELAHMWFGDLVTMAWWEGIWLNEAFATFMETACSDAFRPDWRVWSTFCRSRASALSVDSLSNTRPVEYAVITPDDAEDMFDVITYEKGAALVRMLEQYLGPEVFRAGVQLYLRRHAHANTVTRDLWDALGEASGEPVNQIMESWIHQGGYPAVNCQPNPRDSKPGSLKITQHHFTLDPSHRDDRLWAIPLRLRVQTSRGAERELRMLLRSHENTLDISADRDHEMSNAADVTDNDDDATDENVSDAADVTDDDDDDDDATDENVSDAADVTDNADDATDENVSNAADVTDDQVPTVVTLNSGAAGFYRCLLDAETLETARVGGLGGLSADERHGVINDAWAFSLVGQPDAATFLEFVLSCLPSERDLVVWQAVEAPMAHLRRLLDGAAAQKFGELVTTASHQAIQTIGLDPPRHGTEEARRSELRGLLLRLRGATAGDPETIAACRDRLDHPDPTLAAAALSVSSVHGDAAEFRRVKTRYETAKDPQTEQRHLAALADFPDRELVVSILQETLGGSVRSQDGPYLLRRALANHRAGPAAWDFLARNWNEIKDRFPANSLARMLQGVTSLDTPELARSVRRFVSGHPVPQGAKQIAQHIERLDTNVAFRVREADRLARAVLGF